MGLIFDERRMGREGKEHQRLTVEDVRRFAGFERRSDEEIRQIIIAVEKLSILIFKKFNKTESVYEQTPQLDQIICKRRS